MKTVSDRLRYLIDSASISPYYLSKETSVSEATLSRLLNNHSAKPSIRTLSVLAKYFNVNKNWLLTGQGEMLVNTEIKPQKFSRGENQQGNLIPLYNDVASIGGNNELVANVGGVTESAEYIDTGDWFRDATAAIRHYGESMIEYPSGCILALKEVKDRELIIPGRDYCIETSEYRVTKRIQKGSDKNHWTAYSTNPTTYADGRLIHEPFEINKNAVRRIFLVLGYVVKKNGGTMVYSNK